MDDVSCFIIDQNVLTMAVSKSQNIAHWKNKEKTSDELEIKLLSMLQRCKEGNSWKQKEDKKNEFFGRTKQIYRWRRRRYFWCSSISYGTNSLLFWISPKRNTAKLDENSSQFPESIKDDNIRWICLFFASFQRGTNASCRFFFLVFRNNVWNPEE